MDRRAFLTRAPAAAALGLAPGLVPHNETLRLLGQVDPSVTRRLDALGQASRTLPDDEFWKAVRTEFMLNPGVAHFNCATLGATPHVILDAIAAAMREIEGSPAVNVFGPVGARMVEVKRQAAAFLGSKPDETVLTRNTTEGMNMVAEGIDFQPGDEVLTTTHEHHGGLVGWEHAEKYRGIRIIKVPIPAPARDAGQIVQAIRDGITDRTRVISVSHVCTITGIRMPLAQIAALARPRGILLVCDGAQAPGMLEIDVKALGVDTYASSSHKWMLASKGTGLLYIRKEIQERVHPIFLFSGYSPYTASSGTRNVAQILGHGVAMAFHQRIGVAKVEQRCLSLAALLRDQLAALEGLHFLTSSDPELASGIVSVGLDRARNGEVATALRSQDIIVKVIPIPDYNGLRFSTHIYNSERDVERLVTALQKLL
ncbi:MAG: selenocysteine lyase/cysteine desulfurase [Rhodothermales bacterium]|jgi:selenocysteine lyase/cysteine desulfurase